MKHNLTDLRNFVETSSCTSIVEAARKLEISQPALSESLKKLELQTGALLFYRSRSGIQLTASGRIFLPRAQNVLRALQDLNLNKSEQDIFAGRSLSIGCHPTVAQYTLPQALMNLKKKAPDFQIELKHGLSREIQSQIQKGLLDIGVVINPAEVPDLVIRPLAFDEVAVWSSRTATDLDTVLCNSDLFQTQSILKKWRNRPAKVISTESLELIARLAQQKLGYAVLPERAVNLLALPGLRKHPELPAYKDRICLVYRPEFGKNKAEKLLIECLQESLG